jgi:hypothetical protein
MEVVEATIECMEEAVHFKMIGEFLSMIKTRHTLSFTTITMLVSTVLEWKGATLTRQGG